VISLLQRLSSKPVPNILPVHRSSHLERDREVSTLDCQIESRVLVLHEMERNLGVPLFLQIPNDALPDQIGRSDNLQHLVVVLADERQLESILCRINRDGLRLGRAVEAVHDLALDASKVDRLIERLDDPIVAFISLTSTQTHPWGKAYLIWFKVV
jgi:hypothetical protein